MTDKESRIELLTTMFGRFIEGVKILDEHTVIVFTSPLTEHLLMMMHELDKYAELKRVDELLNNMIKNQKE